MSIEIYSPKQIELFKNTDIRSIEVKELAGYVHDFIMELELTTKKPLDEVGRLQASKDVTDFLKSVHTLISFEDFKYIVKNEICTDKYLDRLVTSQVIISIVKSHIESPVYTSMLWNSKKQKEIEDHRKPVEDPNLDTPDKVLRFYFQKIKNDTITEYEKEHSLSTILMFMLKNFGYDQGSKRLLLKPEEYQAITTRIRIREKLKLENIDTKSYRDNMRDIIAENFPTKVNGHIIYEFIKNNIEKVEKYLEGVK